MIKTESLGQVCKKKLEAELTEAEGKIVITKTCLEQRALHRPQRNLRNVHCSPRKADAVREISYPSWK